MLPQTENSQQIDGRKAPRNDRSSAKRSYKRWLGAGDRPHRGRCALDIRHLVPSQGARRARHGDRSSGSDIGFGGIAKTNYIRLMKSFFPETCNRTLVHPSMLARMAT